MALKRLHEGFDVQDDCIVSNTFPMRESDPPGIYLGRDRSPKRNPLYITYWVALDIAQLVGYPPLEVVEALQLEVDRLNEEIDALNANIDGICEERLEAQFVKLLKETKDEILAEQDRATRSLRDAGKFASNASAERAGLLGGGEGSPKAPRGKGSRDASAKPDGPADGAGAVD